MPRALAVACLLVCTSCACPPTTTFSSTHAALFLEPSPPDVKIFRFDGFESAYHTPLGAPMHWVGNIEVKLQRTGKGTHVAIDYDRATSSIPAGFSMTLTSMDRYGGLLGTRTYRGPELACTPVGTRVRSRIDLEAPASFYEATERLLITFPESVGARGC